MLKKFFLMLFILQIFIGGKVFAQEVFICTDDAGISYRVIEESLKNVSPYKRDIAFTVDVKMNRENSTEIKNYYFLGHRANHFEYTYTVDGKEYPVSESYSARQILTYCLKNLL